MSSTLQNILIILGIILIGGIGVYLYTQNSGADLQSQAIDNQAAVETSIFLQRLKDLQTITLDGEILQDERFRSLTDQSKVVVPTPIGRENPFVANN